MMSAEELRESCKKRKLCQLGYVTSDLQRSMKDWVERLHVGPWRVVTMNNQSCTGSGFLMEGALQDAPYEYYIAISYIGDMQVELIQPGYGPTIYQQFIDTHGEGIHHYKELISPEDWDANLKAYADRGMPVTMQGQFGLAKFAYVDSEPFVNFQVEFGDNIPNPTFPEAANVWYYPEK